jgi:hypothetical protein
MNSKLVRKNCLVCKKSRKPFWHAKFRATLVDTSYRLSNPASGLPVRTELAGMFHIHIATEEQDNLELHSEVQQVESPPCHTLS